MEAFGMSTAEDWLDDDEAAVDEFEETAWVSCPYCGESVEFLLDPSGGTDQEYVEDCEVCCRPWHVRVAVDHSGHPNVILGTLDEE